MKTVFKIFVVAGILGSATIVLSISTGPPDGRTGAPLESNCTEGCHFSFPLNSGNGSFSITAPATYTPGQTLNLNVHIEDPGQSRWGFELTALDAQNLPAGELVVTDAIRTQKTIAAISGREYVKHTLTGTNQIGMAAESDWQLQWVASGAIVSPVTFYAAGNAANNNSLSTGDYIYTTSLTVNQEVLSACCQDRVGDANGLGGDEPTIGDVSVMIDAKFISGTCAGVIACIAEADINQSGGTNPTCDDVTIGDISVLIDYLFITGPALGLADCS